MIVTTGASGTDAGNITIANAVGWFSDYSLTLTAANNISLSSGANLISAGNGNIILTATAGALTNAGSIRTAGGSLTVSAGTIITGAGNYIVAGAASFSAISDITLSTSTNKFSGNVSLLSTSGAVAFINANATTLKGATAGAGGISIASTGSITTATSPTGISTSGPLSLTTAAGSNGSILYSGAASVDGAVTLSADGTGAIAMPGFTGAVTFAAVTAGGAITLASSGDVTLDSSGVASTVITGNAAAGGQASGIVSVTGRSITLNDNIVTSGGNVNLIATTGAVTDAVTGANITTTGQANTGTSSGTVTVTAANGISLQNIITTGAANTQGVGSNAAAVTLTATTGDLSVGAITTTGGAATAGGSTNRNGGNAGSIILGATTGTIYLKGDLLAIGGGYVGTASQGLGGYIEVDNQTITTSNRLVDTGATSGDVWFKSSINSDSTPRSLSVNVGIGSITFHGAIGATAPLSTLTVTSSIVTKIEGNVTTNAAGGVSIAANTTRLGDNALTNGSGAITINTLAGNGAVTFNGSVTSNTLYMDDLSLIHI